MKQWLCIKELACERKIKMNRYQETDGLKAYAIIGIFLMHVLANGEYGIEGLVFERLIPSFKNLVFLFMMVSGLDLFCGYYQKIVDQKICVDDFYKDVISKFGLSLLSCVLLILWFRLAKNHCMKSLQT